MPEVRFPRAIWIFARVGLGLFQLLRTSHAVRHEVSSNHFSPLRDAQLRGLQAAVPSIQLTQPSSRSAMLLLHLWINQR